VGITVRGLLEAILFRQLGTKLHRIVAVSGASGEELLEASDEAVKTLAPIVQAVGDALIEEACGGVVRKVEHAPEAFERTFVELLQNAADIDHVEAGARAELECGRECSAGG
jgi:hypothetical protein